MCRRIITQEWRLSVVQLPTVSCITLEQSLKLDIGEMYTIFHL
jgi:hypothetical protein